MIGVLADYHTLYIVICCVFHCVVLPLKNGVHGVHDLLHDERLTLDLVVLQIAELRQLGAQIVGELAAVELAYEDLLWECQTKFSKTLFYSTN